MKKEWAQRKRLLRSGCFLDEAKSWSHWDWEGTPWVKQLTKERSKLVTRWCKETGRKRSEVSPVDLRLSFSYRVMVKQWYRDHGWLSNAGDRDAFAALRAFRDPWVGSPKGKDYLPPWITRRTNARKRRQAIDDQFSAAAGLQVI
jgi:hypothetical protein